MQAPGVLELLANGWISGWAARQADGQPSELLITLNGQPLAPALANQTRRNAAAANTNHDGFLVPLPTAALPAEMACELHVVLRDGRPLKGSPLRFKPNQVLGRVGAVRQLHLSGWATTRLSTTAPVSVELLVDGQPQSAMPADLLRDDLNQLGPSARVGWRLPLPACALDGMPHALNARALGSSTCLAHTDLVYQASDEERRQWQLEQALTQAQALSDAGDELSALAFLEALQPQFPESLSPTLQAATLAQQIGLLPLAHTLFGQVTSGKHKFLALCARIQCASQLTQWADAQHALEALHTEPGNPAQRAWAAVTVQSQHSHSAAQATLGTAVADEPRPLWQGKLLQWANALGVPLPALRLATLSPMPALAQWQIGLPHAQALMRQGHKHAARALIQALPEPPGNSEFARKQAEFWLDAGQLRHARTALVQAVAHAPTPPCSQDDTQNLHKLAAACHEFGEAATRDELMQRYLHPPSRPQADKVMAHLAQLVRDGQPEAARQGLAQLQVVHPQTPMPAWEARLSREMGQHLDTLHHLAPLVQAPRVTLGDARLWLFALIDANQSQRAESELARLSPLFAPREVLSLRVHLLKLNLEHHEAAEHLQHALKDGDNKGLRNQLAELLIALGDAAASQALIDEALAQQPADWGWAQLHLRWIERFSNSWTDWFTAAQQLRRKLGLRARLHLMQIGIHKLTVTGQFEEAQRRLAVYTKLIDQRIPMSLSERNTQRLQCASLYIPLNRPDDAGHWLRRAQQHALSAAHWQLLCRTAASLQTICGRQAKQAAHWLNQLPETRHHLHLLPLEAKALATPAPAGQAGDWPRTAVLFHLFYPDLWQEFWPALQSLRGTPFNLFITVGAAGCPPAVLDQARLLDPQAVVRTVENWGFDVGAHFQSIDHIDLARYDTVLLLQSKKSRHIRTGHLWRENLRHALIGTPAIWQANLQAFSNDAGLGMLASGLHRGSLDSWTYPTMRAVLDALGVPHDHATVSAHYEYAAGTMFVIRAPLLAEVHRALRHRIRLESYDELSIGLRLDYSHGHALERAFGIYTRWRGYRLGWLPWSSAREQIPN